MFAVIGSEQIVKKTNERNPYQKFLVINEIRINIKQKNKGLKIVGSIFERTSRKIELETNCLANQLRVWAYIGWARSKPKRVSIFQ